MDAFSYLAVLLSIVLGLGLTQLLTALGRLIRHRDRVRVDWLPLLGVAVLLMIYVQVWWSMFGLRQLREWTFIAFLTVLAQTAAKDVILTGRLPALLNLAFQIVLGVGCVAALVVRRRRLQEVVGVTCAATVATYIGLLFTRLR